MGFPRGWLKMLSKLLLLAILPAAVTSRSIAQTAPADVPAVPAQASLRPVEAPLAGFVRVDKNTLGLTLAKQKLLLYDFEFNGDTVPTDKLHLRQISPGVFEITSIAYTVGEWHVRIRDAADYYGLGEHSDVLNHARTVVHNVSLTGPAQHEGAVGSSTSKPVPFFMSTTGYGMWFNVTGDATFDLNASSEADIVVDADAEKLRIVLFTGPEFAKILDAFTAQAGRSVLPPYWAFAPWLGGEFEGEARLQETADRARSLGLPVSVILGEAPTVISGGAPTANSGGAPTAIPGGAATMAPATIKHLHDGSFKVLVPAAPSVNTASPEYAEANASGFFVKLPGGAPYIDHAANGPASLVDFTNARAKLWWQGQLRQTVAGGVDGFESGDAPVFPAETKFNDESDSRVMRNRYAVLENNALEEIVEKDMKGKGALLMRTTTTGANGGLVYNDGGHASFSPEDGLPTVITAGVNAGLSGMPLWMAGLRDHGAGAADAQMLMRWTEYTAFTPVMVMTSKMLPWDWGDAALGVYRRYSMLHMSLFPYRYAAAQEAARTGMPIMQALVLKYQDDEVARQTRNEYLFGPDMLVAPIVDQGTQRTVYLPKGEWLDYWSGKAISGGGVIVADAAVDSIPLYVRSGAILPKIPEDVMTLVPASEGGNPSLKTLDDRRVYELYGSAAATPAAITDFEGRAVVYSGKLLTITGDPAAHVILRWRYQKIASAAVDGVSVKLQADGSGQFIEFDYNKQSKVEWQ